MMRAKSHGAGFLIAAGLLCLPRAEAISPVRLSGAIAGQVTDSAGVPQMGATVLLFNRFDRLAQKVITDQKGAFVFAGLLPDLYSVRVTLAAFVPAVRDHIVVQPGMRSLLNVSLANLFSSIQLMTPSGEQRALMSEDWKWVLRGSSETRPILRYIPRAPEPQRQHAAMFSDTRGVLRLSAGDSDPSSTWGQNDLGTAFALATSLYGNNLLQFSGRLGYASGAGIPSAAFRTSFSRNVRGASPEVSITMRQLLLPGRFGAAMTGEAAGALPALRSSSLNFEDRTQLSDAAWLHYGFSLDSVSFLQRLNYFSPFARLSYDLGDAGLLDFTYTSGNPRPDLAAPQSSDFQRDLNTLGLFPRVSLRDGRAHVQRGENLEAAYSRRFGSRNVQVTGYRESVNNAALTLAGPDDLFSGEDILPDLYSSASVFNAGRYETMGFTASVTQDIGSNFSATLIYGSIGALGVLPGEVNSENPDQLRAMIRAGRRNAATLRTNATIPASGTHLVASYQWTDQKMVSPGRIYSTSTERPEPGFNLYVRQPVPAWSLLPWRMEITGDLRNLLAQGYVPLNLAGGRRAFLMQTPRSFRGGLSFIF